MTKPDNNIDADSVDSKQIAEKLLIQTFCLGINIANQYTVRKVPFTEPDGKIVDHLTIQGYKYFVDIASNDLKDVFGENPAIVTGPYLLPPEVRNVAQFQLKAQQFATIEIKDPAIVEKLIQYGLQITPTEVSAAR